MSDMAYNLVKDSIDRELSEEDEDDLGINESSLMFSSDMKQLHIISKSSPGDVMRDNLLVHEFSPNNIYSPNDYVSLHIQVQTEHEVHSEKSLTSLSRRRTRTKRRRRRQL